MTAQINARIAIWAVRLALFVSAFALGCGLARLERSEACCTTLASFAPMLA